VGIFFAIHNNSSNVVLSKVHEWISKLLGQNTRYALQWNQGHYSLKLGQPLEKVYNFINLQPLLVAHE
jgi:hypothetical protein